MVDMKLRSRQWLVDGKGRIIMGEGRMKILETIEEKGSINKTAKALNMSYKTVWSKIKSTEKHFKKKVVHADKRTGTRLSEAGIELMEKYRLLKKRCVKADDRVFNRIF